MQFVPPFFGDNHPSILLKITLHTVSLLISMDDQFLDIFLTNSVEYIEEIVSVRNSTFGKLVREKGHEFIILFHERPKLYD